MLVLSQVASPATRAVASVTASTSGCCRCSSSSLSSAFKLASPNTNLFAKSRSKCNPRKNLSVTVAKTDGPATKQPTASISPPFSKDEGPVLVGQDSVPLEGVIQFEKPNSSSRIEKWGKIGLLAGGDVMLLLLFAAIGRFSHGFSVLDVETLRTADPFIAGWFLSAYFLGGYSDDGRGMNGLVKAVVATAKSWAVGIPLGIGIRAATSGHVPPASFILVSMGSTAVLLIGWRTLLFSLLPGDRSKKNDTYKRGSPFELFELLTSLVRRW